MKKRLLGLSMLCGAFMAQAQQDAQYSQFFHNRLNFNPAFAGTEEDICVLGVFRSQWIGFGNDKDGLSPTTFMGSINAPIGQRIGVGLNVMQDQLGFESSTNPMFSLSYRHLFQNQSMLSGGIGVGFMQKKIAGDKLRPLQPGDPIIPTAPETGFSLDLNAGLYYTMPNLWIFQNFYSGLSATHINQGKVSYTVPSGTVDVPMRLHTFFMTGAQYQLNSTFTIEPNLFLKYDMANISFDLNGMLEYNNTFRGGLSYRTGDAFSVLIGYRKGKFLAGYSYDLTTSKIIQYSSGSHELLVKYCFAFKTKIKTPPTPVPRLTPRFL